ncbi:MAG: type II toxin-antitoxin system RelE/ParE family toxin [Lachnospiraceae bacterium]|nr:type II toxin-antitoxin system RelE/ParE family toxin [Lachnospiraceae bacterium]
MNPEYEVIFYDLPDGTEPAIDFINSQPKKMGAKILRNIGLLEDAGPSLREPYSGPLGDGIFELRTKLGSDITRVLYFFMSGKKVILTHCFVKKTQETPPGEIDKAKRYRTEYLSRPEND